MKTDPITAARAILTAARKAADGSPVTVQSVKIRPRPAAVLVAWDAGACHGELKLEFTRLPMQLIPEGNPTGIWERGNGVFMSPLGRPMPQALGDIIKAIAFAAAWKADVYFPTGVQSAAAALSLPMKPKKQKPVPPVKAAKPKKITAANVIFWLGNENPSRENLREAAEMLADIANKTYDPKTLRDDIAGTCDL